MCGQRARKSSDTSLWSSAWLATSRLPSQSVAPHLVFQHVDDSGSEACHQGRDWHESGKEKVLKCKSSGLPESIALDCYWVGSLDFNYLGNKVTETLLCSMAQSLDELGTALFNGSSPETSLGHFLKPGIGPPFFFFFFFPSWASHLPGRHVGDRYPILTTAKSCKSLALSLRLARQAQGWICARLVPGAWTKMAPQTEKPLGSWVSSQVSLQKKMAVGSK